MKKSTYIVPNIEKLFGPRDENPQILEEGLNVNVALKSDCVQIEGAARDVTRAEHIFTDFDCLSRSGHDFSQGDLRSMLRVVVEDESTTLRGLAEAAKQRSFAKRQVHPKSINPRRSLYPLDN